MVGVTGLRVCAFLFVVVVVGREVGPAGPFPRDWVRIAGVNCKVSEKLSSEQWGLLIVVITASDAKTIGQFCSRIRFQVVEGKQEIPRTVVLVKKVSYREVRATVQLRLKI